MSQEQETLIRQSLLNTIFTKYNDLVKALKDMPFDPTTNGLLKSISFIDDGIVWAKEIIMTAPLVLGSQNKEESKPDEQKPDQIDSI